MTKESYITNVHCTAHVDYDPEGTFDETEHSLGVLVRYAKGEISHINLGMCPDLVEGFETKDTDCAVCQAIKVIEETK